MKNLLILLCLMFCFSCSKSNSCNCVESPIYETEFDLKVFKDVYSLSQSGANDWDLFMKNAGVMRIKSKRLSVIDPGYFGPVNPSVFGECVPDGEIYVQMAYLTGGFNKGSPAFVILSWGEVCNSDKVEIAKFDKLQSLGGVDGCVGVDTGTICILDESLIPIGDEAKLHKFGMGLIEGMDNKDIVINPTGTCVVFRSGNGDGSYPCYWLKDKNCKIIALVIDFMNWRPASRGVD